MSFTKTLPAALLCCSIFTRCSAPNVGDETSKEKTSVAEGTIPSIDGTPIAYSARGRGETALVFIHGGFCDRSFWTHQVEAFRSDYRVVTLDLAGHGSSGTRENWTLAAFGEDVKAVVDALKLERVVLIGHSMGGPVSLRAASLLPDKVIGVIGVDTLQNAERQPTKEQWRARIEAFRDDFDATCSRFVREIFTEGADPDLITEVEHRMCNFPPETAIALLETFSTYDMANAMRRAEVPIWCINGDLYPTDIEGNRRYAPSFNAVIMERMGHFPMLVRPDELNRHLAEALRKLDELDCRRL